MKNICKCCGQEKKLIKAHIIPKRFFIDYKDEQYMLVNPTNGDFKLKQNGSWDNNILCAECDGNILGVFDKEGARILLDEIEKHCVKKSINGAAYSMTSEYFNYQLFRNFLISILWRASISNLDEFKEINLGPYEKKAFEILNNIKDYDNLFKTLIFKYPEDKDFNKLTFIAKGKFANCTTYVINMAGYYIVVIVNYKNFPHNLKQFYKYLFLNEKCLNVIESNDFYLRNKGFTLNKMYEMWQKGYKPPFPPKKTELK